MAPQSRGTRRAATLKGMNALIVNLAARSEFFHQLTLLLTLRLVRFLLISSGDRLLFATTFAGPSLTTALPELPPKTEIVVCTAPKKFCAPGTSRSWNCSRGRDGLTWA